MEARLRRSATSDWLLQRNDAAHREAHGDPTQLAIIQYSIKHGLAFYVAAFWEAKPTSRMASSSFDPDAFFENWSDARFIPTEQNFRLFSDCIREAFSLPASDAYTYRAQGTTTLDLTQRAINGKRKNGLHDWYHDENRQNVVWVPTPPSSANFSPLSTLQKR
jgi:hypothetical protein